MNIEAFLAGFNWGNWNYLIMFIISFLESIPFLGLLIPGQTLVALAGFAAHLKLFNLTTLIIVISFAAITGDCLTYYLGRRYGLKFLRRWGKYFFLKKKYIKKTQNLITHHLGKSLILGRLHSFTRSFAPFLAGAHKAPFLKFLSFTIIGGVLWALLFTLIGYFIGESFRYFERYLGIAFLAVLLLVLCWNFMSTSLKKTYSFFSTESKLIGAVGVISFLFFIRLLRSITREGFWMRTDQNVAHTISSLHTNVLTFVAKILDVLFDPISLSVISLLILGILLQSKKKKEALFFLGTMFIGLCVSEIAKQIIHRARPSNGLVLASGFSFPSGHAMISTIFLGLIAAYFCLKDFSKIKKQIILLSTTFLILLIGASRVYLNVHWITDVLAGIALGMVILSISIFFWIASEKIKSPA